MKISINRFKTLNYKHYSGLAVVLAVALIGAHFMFGSFAAPPNLPYVASEIENGTVSAPAVVRNDPSASNGKYVSLGSQFNYGFDFSDAGPDPASMPFQDTNARSNIQTSVDSAMIVLSKFSGSFMDQSIYGFGGQNDPQDKLCNPNTVPAYSNCPAVPIANSSNTDLTSIKSRIQLITNAGGVPVITLVQAPQWMYQASNCPNGVEGSYLGTLDTNINTPGVTAFSLPPCPDNYPAFASLSAYIAQSFPQVKYFVVWSEVRDFYNPTSKISDAPNYTNMYNDVFTAIKKVRPDAFIGGPYAALAADPCPAAPASCSSLSTLNGAYGYVSQNMLNVLSYWLTNKTGADFIAIDGGTEIAKANNGNGDSSITDPVTSSEKYAYVDNWIKAQPGFNNLPIWWMESHIAPSYGMDSGGNTVMCLPVNQAAGTTCWTDAQGAAARIATLILMNTSGASVGMQWQPQGQYAWPDEGLWSSTEIANGGKSTVLANELATALPVINQRLTLISGQPTGILAASEDNNLIVVNTNNTASIATVHGTQIPLNADEVKVTSLP